MLSSVWLFAKPWTGPHQAPLSMEFSREEYWSELSFPSPGNLPDPGIEPGSPAFQADSLPSETPGSPNWVELNWMCPQIHFVETLIPNVIVPVCSVFEKWLGHKGRPFMMAFQSSDTEDFLSPSLLLSLSLIPFPPFSFSANYMWENMKRQSSVDSTKNLICSFQIWEIRLLNYSVYIF